MNQIFTPGQTVYLLYWRRPEDKKLTRVAFYLTKRRRDDANIDLLSWGLITATATGKIPTLVKSVHQKGHSRAEKARKCEMPWETNGSKP